MAGSSEFTAVSTRIQPACRWALFRGGTVGHRMYRPRAFFDILIDIEGRGEPLGKDVHDVVIGGQARRITSLPCSISPACRCWRLTRIEKDSDVLAYDSELKQLYVSAESVTVTVFRENGKAVLLDGTLSMPHAHTVCVDPDTHLVYFPLQSVEGRPVLRIMEPSPPLTVGLVTLSRP